MVANEEPFAGEELRTALEAEGIDVVVGVGIAAVRRDRDDGPVVGTLEDDREVEADEILVAVGRRPNSADLGLEVVGVEPGKSVPVDDQLRVDGGRRRMALRDRRRQRPRAAHAHGEVPGAHRRRRDRRTTG